MTILRHLREWRRLRNGQGPPINEDSSGSEKLLRDSLEKIRKEVEQRYLGQIERLELEMQRVNEQHEEELDGVQAELEELEQALEREKLQRTNADADVTRSKNEAEAHKILVRNYKERAEDFESRCVNSAAELNAKTSELARCHQELQDVKVEHAQLESAVLHLQQKTLKAENDVAELRGRLRGQASRILRSIGRGGNQPLVDRAELAKKRRSVASPNRTTRRLGRRLKTLKAE